MKKNVLKPAIALFLVTFMAVSDAAPGTASEGFKRPAQEISRLLLTAEPPTPVIHVAAEKIALLHYEGVIDQQRMQTPRLGLAGYRYDPVTGITGLDALVERVEIISSNPQKATSPRQWRAGSDSRSAARFAFVQFSPSGKYLSALQVEPGKPSQFLIYNIESRQQTMLSTRVNAAWGNPCQWTTEESLLCRMRPLKQGRAPQTGVSPIVVEHTGQALPTRTYSNLLKDQSSSAQFDYYFASDLAHLYTDKKVVPTRIAGGMITEFEAAPQGRFVIITRLQSSYSHLVPAKQFPSQVEVWDLQSSKRLYQSAAFGFGLQPDEEGGEGADPKSIEWAPNLPVTAGFIQRRVDASGAATYIWKRLRAPFEVGVDGAETVAISDYPIKEFGWSSAGTPWFIAATNKPDEVAVYAVLKAGVRRVWQGTRDQGDGSNAIRVNGRQGPALETKQRIFLVTDGLNHDAPRPSLTEVNLHSGEQRRLFTAEAGVYEPVIAILDKEGEVLLTSRESATDAPQLVRVAGNKATTIYKTPNPYPQLDKIVRKRITYKRQDGLKLSALMYLPPNAGKKPLATLIWIYPREFEGPEKAARADARQFQYHRIKGVSPVAAALAGYVVINYPKLPIVHTQDNDDVYLPQLVTGAESLVDYLVEEGISDPKRIVIGGHSFGAFSAANLLIHSDRFATAIAMSGAYNRTLTPFGFQHETRSFWDAEDYYAKISPFFSANQYKKPILLVHGGADPNPGTPTIQARRFFHALVGEGVTVRYVELPFEEHVYRGEETVLHASWEMINWLDRTVGEKPDLNN
ncbi:MAG: S9 family peptidase [Ketobacter sp.]|nr:MAG: S9 family peptidase [Ketobacter sp.]